MSSSQNGRANGAANGHPTSKRFSNIPSAIDVPVQGDQEDEAVEIDLEALMDDPTELCTLFENERAARTYWMTVAMAYAKQKKVDHAIDILNRGSSSMQDNNPKEKLSIVTCLCWMNLWKSREAPRIAKGDDQKTKDYYIQVATASLNEASRINPAFPPLFLARGVLLLLKASLQAPSKSSGADAIDQDKVELLRNAIKAFDQASKVSQGKNMLALLGKARAMFSLGQHREALVAYQDVLRRMPDLVDPDPRIGIGCCFWQLGYKDDARMAWERSLEINPDSKTSNILLGLYYLDASGNVPVNSPEFAQLYKKAMTEYTQKSFKLDKNQPLTCATFSGYFLSTRNYAHVESLANKAIQYTDVNAIASDGWYLLARKEHSNGNTELAADYYRRADEARGGVDRGFLPAKFGLAQLSVLNNDLGEAKLRLEKIVQPTGKKERNYEAMILLGALYAEEVSASQFAATKEDKSAEKKKAIDNLEQVRTAWKDPKKNLSPDAAVLLNLARLYENDQPEKALQCLQQVEQLELDQIPASEHPTDIQDETALRNALRRNLPPQLLNNIGCFYSQAEKHEQASAMFEAALGSCIRIGEKDDEIDTDALVTTISFNLGRSYEAQDRTDEAQGVYEKLIARHDDYTDAQARLAYIKLRKSSGKEGPDAVAKLYQENPSDLDVRALYGWYLGKVNSRKRNPNVNEDPELRHYKHTLQNYDKHDRYALVGMGNLYLMAAREMRRDTDQEKQKRSAQYTRAVEFFDKALQLDPKNAYAAQGIAIALVEDKKDYKTALPIFLKVRETVKDPNVNVNIGHIYAELRQFSKAIENYEQALAKSGKENDSSILACLGRTWLNKGRHEKSLDAHATALEYAQKALAAAPDQVHFKFNVAFVQIQLVQHIIMHVPETQRTLEQLEKASDGLEAAILALDEIAGQPQPPYPKAELEQRASMARNTQRKQLARQIESQKEYEEKNKEKLSAALEQRQAELKKRDEERQKALALELERKQKIAKEREEIAARDRELAEIRLKEDQERAAAEMTTDSETGEQVRRKKKTSTKKRVAEDGEPAPKRRSKKSKKAAADDGDSEDETQPKKRRRLAAKKENSKYKSAELVVDSSDDEDYDALDRAEKALERSRSDQSDADDASRGGSDDEADDKMEVDHRANQDDDDDEVGGASAKRALKRARRGRVLDDSDEDEDEGGGSPRANGGKADTSMVDEDDDE
ncbi:tetratricopeptide [Microdochium trichocladiopsis]|uniref:Tetratricopeptide n=1 Tax=Microdochium trichocladiopsis TaxID=1682393 RepID=A0A9P8YIP6_9PEZI|nr:tetratricopeptide [Microdochium trichocladiopsis]KAH7041104.1 tetratricopeptide [Microdochium trichocladiopsis]